MSSTPPAVSIVVPTYNERENVAALYEGVCRALEPAWAFEIIFVDDASPDGTAEVVEELQQRDPRVRLLRRSGKLGLGSAVRDGFNSAATDRWVMMDADLSHDPQALPALIGALDEADIAVGSRYVPGGGVEKWPRWRRLASRVANGAGRMLVGLPTRDVTSGFAAFRREALELVLPRLRPKGFKLLLEVLAHSRGARVVEVPIRFADRRYGHSKFTTGEVLAYLRLCWRLRSERHRDAARLEPEGRGK